MHALHTQIDYVASFTYAWGAHVICLFLSKEIILKLLKLIEWKITIVLITLARAYTQIIIKGCKINKW